MQDSILFHLFILVSSAIIIMFLGELYIRKTFNQSDWFAIKRLNIITMWIIFSGLYVGNIIANEASVFRRMFISIVWMLIFFTPILYASIKKKKDDDHNKAIIKFKDWLEFPK